MTAMDTVKEKIEAILNPKEEQEDDEDIDIDKLNLDEILGKNAIQKMLIKLKLKITNKR